MTISNIPSKATVQTMTKIRAENPGAKGTKIRSICPGHMINMATMSTYGKKT